jgi:signal transduction histidine kinase/ActR/RegA family two-component response regulator
MPVTPSRSQTPKVTPRHHIVRFYEDDSFICAQVAQFFLEGHREGASCVMLATAKHRQGIERALEDAGVDVREAKKLGRLIALDAEDTLRSFIIGGLDRGVLDPPVFRSTITPVLERAAAVAPAGLVLAYGEMVDLLLRRGNESAMAHLEELWNELGKIHTFELYCSYRMSNLDRVEDHSAFEKICRLHSHVLPAESYDENSNTEDRRRQVAQLQQRARALETEIVERKKLDRALREEQDHLRDANRRKDEFLAMLGHELRNPLNPILTALDLMDMRGDEHSRRERDIIRRQALHLADLVEDLLDVSRVTGGKVTLRKEPTEIASVIAKAIEMASPLLEQRAHLLQIGVPQRGLLVDADPVRLAQVFANLVMNAAKYTERGGTIEIAARRDGPEIVVACKDDGIGISTELLGTMFEPFVQGSRSLDRAEGGMGLGLALVRSLTELHGGNVTAHSEGLGKGSEFSVRLPALNEAPRKEERTEPTTLRSGSGPERAERVLIVDDNADCALGFGEVVRLLGHEVEVAFDGPRALLAAGRFKPTVALIDIGLPVMDGYEVAKRLRETAGLEKLKLVAVTGYGEDANRAMSLAAGFDLHTVKPVELESLRTLLANSHVIGAVTGPESTKTK